MKRDTLLKPKKLTLKKEALRTLGDADLEKVAGGTSGPCTISIVGTISTFVSLRTLSRLCQTV